MKKYIIGGVIVVAVIAYIIFANRNSSTPAFVGPTGTPTTTEPSSSPSTTSPSGNPPSGSTSTATTSSTGSTGQYKDGTYTGSVADAFYGNLQVTVTIQDGAITNVTFPQAPSGGHSGDVSASALPVLAQEAITAQSGNVNVVSGATQDSQAFQQSMASALAQAKS